MSPTLLPWATAGFHSFLAGPGPRIAPIFHLTIASLSLHGIDCSIRVEDASCIRQLVLEVAVVEVLIIIHTRMRGQGFAQLSALFGSLIKINASIFSFACFAGIVHRVLTADATGASAVLPDTALPLGMLHCAFALPWLLRIGPPLEGNKEKGVAAGPLLVHRIPRVNTKIRQPVRHLPGNHQVYVGTIKHFLPEREIGFVEPECGDFLEDLYFKVTALSMELQLLGKGMEGQRVNFVVVYRQFGRAHVRAAVPHVKR